ncbi:SDR family oxidoreductase [candidate division KSB1 bacterium]|nr:SDR family oxidoreductase [candidate division KSB1 bacterium]
MNSLFDLNKKIALITGSSQGIGLTLAQGFAQAGATVVLNGRNTDKLSKAKEFLHHAGIHVYAIKFDVTNEDQIIAGVNRIESEVGPINILVNNAGVQIRGPLESFTKQSWQKILDTNLTGAFLTSKVVVKRMIESKNGKIINICSMQSILARPTIAPYATAKGGLKMLTQSMATEWGKYNIQANGIAPGYFKTELTKTLVEDDTFNTWLCQRTPANRWGEPHELIGAAVFLASDASSYVNGHILFVDGGMAACV